MPGRDLIVIGASAGGVQALTELCAGLPGRLPAAVFVVVHTSPTSPGVLPQILGRAGDLPAAHAVDGEPIRTGRIYVAPPDHHMLVKDGTIRVVRGPKENGFRPAVDPLFRTAARAGGPRVVGVVLSGGLDDGTEGLELIKQCGGVAVVQDPAEAHFPSMPASAIAHVDVDHVLPVSRIAPLVARLAQEPLPEGVHAMSRNGDADDRERPDVAEVGDTSLVSGDLPGSPTGFTCPECGGALWELSRGKLLKFRCHVGHSYTPEGMLAEHTRAVEAALWTGLRALEEHAALRRRMARRAGESRWGSIAGEYEGQAQEAERRATVIRQVLIADALENTALDADAADPRPKWDGRLYDRAPKGAKPKGRKKAPAPNGKGAAAKRDNGKPSSPKAKAGANGHGTRRRAKGHP